MPVTKAGRRFVTNHGDFHPLNILRREDGSLGCIDFEFAHCSRAANDLGYATFMWAKHGSVEQGRDFIRGYLEGMGDAAGAEDVDALLLDSHLAALDALATKYTLEALGYLMKEHKAGRSVKKNAHLASPALAAFKTIVADARCDTVLREEIFNVGLKNTKRGLKVLEDLQGQK